jgi:2-dehydro-3-deoxyphosphogluconate aldolase / (4S)-4-hydroxy-2-oxoglutarate aldolase
MSTEGRSDAEFFGEYLNRTPVMCILRGFSTERTVELCLLAWSLGVDLVEVPLQGAESEEALLACAAMGEQAGHPVGAGTVVSDAVLRTAVRAGARFTVAPGYFPHVAASSRDAGLPHLPGVATATEIGAAQNDGFVWLKAFPANVLGPSWIRAMAGPFPAVRFVATGGIDVDNAQALIGLGCAVSLGSSFASADPERVRLLTGPPGISCR